MNATIGFQLRLPIDVYQALEQLAGPRGKTRLVLDLIRREARRRGALVTPAAEPARENIPRRRRRT